MERIISLLTQTDLYQTGSEK